MIKKLLIISSFVLSLSAKEVSVFGAGDINSQNPYGLSNTEKEAYNNKQKLKKLENNLNQLKTSHANLKERLQGIMSIYEVDSEKLNKNNKAMSNFNNNMEASNATLDKLKQLSVANSDSLITLEKRFDEFVIQEEENNLKIHNSLKSISTLLNKINKNYVGNKQFDELVDFINSNKKPKKTQTKKKKVVSKKLTKKEKFAKAVAMVERRYLTKSIPLWNELIKANYMPASSNYYMGEVRFGKKEYKKAIHHFKTSMMLYDEAEYIPKLLLHSAISFQKIKDNENALNFYNTLIDVYSSSSEAVEARQLIKKIK